MNLEIANRLLQLRKEHGYSQEKLAEKLGISRQAVSKWERAEASPDTDNLVLLARIYNISLDELLLMVPIDEDEKDNADEPLREEAGVPPSDEVLINVSTLKEKTNAFVDDIKKERGFSFPFPVLVLLLFVAFGMFFENGWRYSWLFILTIPMYYSGILAHNRKNAYFFLYPLIPVILYVGGCLLFEFEINLVSYWNRAWVIFLSIPLYYWIVYDVRKRKRVKTDKKDEN